MGASQRGEREERERRERGERERRERVWYLADVSGRAGAHAVGGARDLSVALRDGDERRATIAPYPRLRTTISKRGVGEDAKRRGVSFENIQLRAAAATTGPDLILVGSVFALVVVAWWWVGAYLRVAVGRLVVGDARAVARGGVADAAVRAVRVLLAPLP